MGQISLDSRGNTEKLGSKGVVAGCGWMIAISFGKDRSGVSGETVVYLRAMLIKLENG